MIFHLNELEWWVDNTHGSEEMKSGGGGEVEVAEPFKGGEEKSWDMELCFFPSLQKV